MGVNEQSITDDYAIYCGDCIEVLPSLPDESVGFSVFSPPFADLYCYSEDGNDMGNCKSQEEFFDHFRYLTLQLHRLMKPGRVVAVHCADLPIRKQDSGYMGQIDFPGALVRHFVEHDFIYHGRVCIWKDPLVMFMRTKLTGLAHKQIVSDSSLCRNGNADYVVTFRKKGDNPDRISHPNGLGSYCGMREVPAGLRTHKDPAKNKRSQWIWQQYASPVWFDIRQMRVLPYKPAKEKDDEKHVCPLQLDVIERCLTLWSNPGDTVLTPFMGVGSEAFVAVQMGRRAVGVELKRSYYRQAVRNLERAKESKAVTGLLT